MEYLRHKHCEAQIGLRIASNGRYTDATFIDVRSDRSITRCPGCNQYLHPLYISGELRDEATGAEIRP